MNKKIHKPLKLAKLLLHASLQTTPQDCLFTILMALNQLYTDKGKNFAVSM